MIASFLQMGFVPMMAILFSFILFVTNKTLSKQIIKFYIATDIVFGVLIIADTVDFYLASLETLNNLRYFTSIVGYSLRPLIVVFIILTFIRSVNTPRKTWIIFIPAMINALLCAFTPLTGWVFSFAQDNEFIRGYLGYMPHIVSAIYMIFLFVEMTRKVHDTEKMELILALIMSIGVICAVIIESLLPVRCVLNGVGITSVICYFIYLNTLVYRKDIMTNLLNRRAFYTDSQRITDKIHIVCIDMNNLKEINDKYGHVYGDKALMEISQVLIKNVDRRSKVYRVGGDEFVVFSKLDEEGVEKRFERIENVLKEKNLSIAHGYAYYDGTEDFEKVYTRADQMMYKNKEIMKLKMKESTN